MIVRDGGFSILNAFGITECKIQCDPQNYDSVSVTLRIKIMDHKSGITYGTCPLGGSALSKGTLEKLGDFLRSAEHDFADGLKGDKELPVDINDIDMG